MSRVQSFDFSIDILEAILWQYDSAPNLLAILQDKQDWLDQNHRDFWQNWVRDVFDLRTANDFGCAVWNIILGQPLDLSVPANTDSVFGFGPDDDNFGAGNFGNINGSSISFSTATKRLLLRIRYIQLISSGTVPETNRLLNGVFADLGRVVLLDNHDMTQTYLFYFTPSSELRYALDNLDLLPRPAGVGSSYRVVSENTFGFGEYRLNFNNGNFGA